MNVTKIKIWLNLAVLAVATIAAYFGGVGVALAGVSTYLFFNEFDKLKKD